MTPQCRNCGRTLVPGTKRPWLHRYEDFEPGKPLDCFDPEPAKEGRP